MSSSSSRSQSTYNTTTENLALQEVEGLTLAGIDSSTVNVTDGGTVSAALAFAGDVVRANRETQSEALVFQERAGRAALAFAESAGRPETTITRDQMKYGAAALALVALVLLWRK